MTRQELHDQLAPPSLPQSGRTSKRPSVCSPKPQAPDPQQCLLPQWNQPLPTLYRHVETYLLAQDKSAHTLRNTKNNLSRLWRLAETQGVFTPIPPVLTRRYDREPTQAPWGRLCYGESQVSTF